MKFPVFPLNGAILFPGTNLPLNIFEEKYIQMVDYAFSNNRLIGMIQKKKNGDFFNIGCLGKITNFTETSDGRYQINLEGINRFSFIKKIKTDNKFIFIEGKVVESTEVLEIRNSDFNTRLLKSFKKFIKAKQINFDTSSFEDLSVASLAKIICVISPLDNLVKQMLLEFNSDDEFCKSLLSVLEIEMKNTEINPKVN